MGAITLNTNLYLGTLTNMIGLIKSHNGFTGTGVDEFLNFCKSDDLPHGDTKVIRSVDIPEVENYSENSSLLTIKKPTTAEESLSIVGRRKVELSINRYLLAESYHDSSTMGEFVSLILATMENAKKRFLYYGLIICLATYTPTQETQTIEITLEDYPTSATPQDKEFTNVYNAKIITKQLMKAVRNANFYSDAYNDNQFTQSVSPSRLGLILSGDVNDDLVVDTYATLMNSQEIKNQYKWGKTIVLPEGSFASGVLGYLFEKDKLQYGFGYQFGGSFFDISNLYDKHCLHFSFYMGVIKSPFGVVLALPSTTAKQKERIANWKTPQLDIARKVVYKDLKVKVEK